MTAMLPCPFCGQDKASLVTFGSATAMATYSVGCKGTQCANVIGPAADTAVEAISLWNQRQRENRKP